MVKETRIVFEPKDIYRIRIGCNSCSVEMVFSPRRSRIPDFCPGCCVPWVKGNLTEQTRRESTFFEFLYALREWLEDDHPPVTIRLELDGDVEEEAS